MKRLFCGILAGLLLCLTGCGAQPEPEQLSLFAMDTYMSLAAYGNGASEALAACGQELNRLDASLSRTREGSEIYTLNRQGSADVSRETADLIADAVALSRTTGGAFDPTVAPLVTLWGITTDSPQVPQQEQIDALLPLVGVDHVTADGTHITLDPGCAMDLGGIAKGYASDRLADIFAQYGVDSALVSLGGNVYARGTKPGGAAWSVAVQHPEQDGYAAMLSLTDAFAVTSGGYQRYFTGPDGTVYQHILDPKTGWPVRLTKIRAQDLENAPEFPRAYADFTQWCGEDCCLCTWGPDDIPVLMDNLLMHGMDAEMPCCYDLQRIFGHEIMRDDRQCSLERAMELLHLTPDRAHDALNDARNTVQICGKMDLDGCMDEYRLRYVGYPQDRKAGLVQGREYASLAEAQADPALTETACPYCGETVTLGQWARKDPRTLLAYGRCSQEDELCAVCLHSRTAKGVRLGRTVFEMNDDLWDTYQTCLERQG